MITNQPAVNVHIPWVVYLFKFLPLRAMYVLADILAFIFIYIIPYRKKVIQQNLQNSFPNKSSKEIKSILRLYYHHLADLLIESLKMPWMSQSQLEQRVQCIGFEKIEAHFKNNKPVIGITAHYNNWEWASLLLPSLTSYETLAAYKPLSNKSWNQFIVSLRNSKGLQLIPMKEVLRTLVTKKNNPFFLILIADQTPAKYEIQHWIPFLNQNTPIVLGPEKIAKSFHAPVFFLSATKIKRGYYRYEVKELSLTPEKEEPYQIIKKYYQELESIIQQEPQYWLWSHKRWKHTNNNHATS